MIAGLKSVELNDSILAHVQPRSVTLRGNMTVGEALAAIRQQETAERLIYFYVVDEEERLVGVVPTRRLLTAEPATPLERVMVSAVVAIPEAASVL